MAICMARSATGLARLTERKVKAEIAKRSPERTQFLHDGGGLYLRIDKRGTSTSWDYRYTVCGRARTMGLGPYPTVSLAMAREMAEAARKLRATGHDPLDQRQA